MKQIVDFVKNDKRILITGVIIIFLMILGTVLAFTVGNSVAFTLENDLEEMGRDFYENFYYSQINNSDEEKVKLLEQYSSIGLKVNLENLVRSNKERNEDKTKEFVNPKTKEACNFEKTRVIIYPKSPYGKTDYKVDVELDCGLNEKKK